MKPSPRSPLEVPVTFRPTENPEHPLEAVIDGEKWVLRLGDFPAEPMWTLIIDGDEYSSFNEWPRRWIDPSDPEKQGERHSYEAVTVSNDMRQAHVDWIVRGKMGAGRVDFAARAVTLASRGAELSFARLVRCKLDGASLTHSMLVGIELSDCFGKGVVMNMSTLDDARIDRCDLPGIDLMLGKLRRAKIHGGDFTGAQLDRAFIDDGEIVGAHFPRALFLDANVAGAKVVDCDFREADFSRRETALSKLCTFFGTRFVNCDFRGAYFSGRRLKDTVFEGCKFHGIQGKPAIEGAYRVVEPDFSVEGDDSDVRDDKALDALWK